MRILVLGSTGTLGRAVCAALARHEIVEASRNAATLTADLRDEASLARLLDASSPLDSVVCTAGEAAFGRFAALSTDAFEEGLRTKLLGQIGFARAAIPRLRDHGSITLTAGILSREPVVGSTCAATVNAGLEGFVRSAALDLPRGLRINVVSPTVLDESWERVGAYFAGYESVSASRAALAYVRSVEGPLSGQTFVVQ